MGRELIHIGLYSWLNNQNKENFIKIAGGIEIMKAGNDNGKTNENKLPGIEALAAALNVVESVRTRRVSAPSVLDFSPPQILFESSVEFAAALQKELHADERAASPRLRIPWDVRAIGTDVLTSRFVFGPDFRACFEGLRRPRINLFTRIFRKKELAREVAALEETVGKDYGPLAEMIRTAASHTRQAGKEENNGN